MKEELKKEEQRKKFKVVESMLFNYKENKSKIEVLKVKLDNVTHIRAIDYDKINVMSSNISSAVEGSIIKAEQEQEKLKKLNDEITIVEAAISSLNDTEKKFITERYFEKSKWWKICTEFNIADSTYWLWREKIVKKLINVIYV